ncbi:hypothetical protein ACS0TY_001239 [Phlomoides rotata]
MYNRICGGRSVQDVYVNERGNRRTEFGKIIFTSTDPPRRIMLNRERVSVWIGDKALWLKKYIPRSQRNNQN